MSSGCDYYYFIGIFSPVFRIKEEAVLYETMVSLTTSHTSFYKTVLRH